jgi:hypothetical protein
MGKENEPYSLLRNPVDWMQSMRWWVLNKVMKRQNNVEHIENSIQYVGLPGLSAPCRAAVMRLLQFGDKISLVQILSAGNRHCLLLTVNEQDLVAVKSGFGSGYIGEGSRTFSYVIQLLDAHGAEIREYEVEEAVIQRLDQSALQVTDIKNLAKSSRRGGGNWYDHILDKHYKMKEAGTLWAEFDPVMPFAIIDPRISDLATTFWEGPDAKLLTGYRRLEDLLRARMKTEEYGQKICSVAFNPKGGRLTWDDIPESEAIGRMQLFTGAFMAYRNPRAHKESEWRTKDQLSEFLLLNMLYTMERQATDRKANDVEPGNSRDDATLVKV